MVHLFWKSASTDAEVTVSSSDTRLGITTHHIHYTLGYALPILKNSVIIIPTYIVFNNTCSLYKEQLM